MEPTMLPHEKIALANTQSEILSILTNYQHIIVSMANGEPDYILNLIDEHPEAFTNLTIHQMLELKDCRYIQGEYPNIRYVSYFLSKYARKSFLNGTCDLIPNHFHQMPRLLEKRCPNPLVVSQASPMDDEGYFSLGTSGDYTTHFIGKAPFVLQVNNHVPKTHGKNRIHISQIAGFVQYDQSLHELPNAPIRDIDQQIAEYVAERIENGSTLQVGIGGIPNAVVSLLKDHRDLGIHTEMLTDGVYDLVTNGVITGTKKHTHPEKIIMPLLLGPNDFMTLWIIMSKSKCYLSIK